MFDSGSAIADLLAEQAPAIFNANSGSAGDFDSRSDDKGTEPEAVTVARLAGRTYAFVGLERAGGIVIYDVTYPAEARLLGYANDVNPHLDDPADVSPEGLTVVPADASPTGVPLLLVANEISLTVTVYEIVVSNR